MLQDQDGKIDLKEIYQNMEQNSHMYIRNPKAVLLCSILGELIKEDASLSD